MAEISFNTLALGYLRAERRLTETRQATTSSSELFIPLLETLSWVYALLLYDERSQHSHVPKVLRVLSGSFAEGCNTHGRTRLSFGRTF